MPTVALGAVKNRGVLFAQVYIDSILAKIQDSNGSSLLETLEEWFSKTDRSSLGNYVSSFVGPVLDVQGFVRGELSDNKIFLFEDRNRTKPLSLCYVVDSTESLDQTVKGKNYAVSLIKELKKAGLRWGILTNGSSWRLYYTKEKALFETFFQIDLGRVIENKDKREGALFTQFFNAQSFLLDEKGKCHLDRFRQESEEATREIEDHLQSKMEDILGKICMGFIKSEGKQSYTEEEKRAVFNNSIYLLYRLLFVLYAEARGFLPIQDPEYYEKSISKIMVTVREYHCKGVANPQQKVVWNTLSEVFNWINQGNHALGIPPYNGGLFDNDEKPYLANHSIDDAFLSEALFSLGYREKKDEIIPISYDDLSVRHLGSLYEGILEYQLFIAPEKMVRRKEKDGYKFIAETHAGKVTRTDTIIEKGEVYFSQSSGERKMTGSYYTPEDVVRYIVDNSLGQYLAEVEQELKPVVNNFMSDHKTAVDEKERHRIEKFIDKEIVAFVEKKVLTIKVLDLSMGSGHFLVNAAHHLANFIVDSLCSTDWENNLVDTSPLLWRRRVVEKCIFGVDLNVLATELAKLSLWLITADNRKPLTFIDHHLRTGNSLLGVDLKDMGDLPNVANRTSYAFQVSLLYPAFRDTFIPRVLKIFNDMEVSSEDIGDVDLKKSRLREWERLRNDLKYVADAWLATLFDYGLDEHDYQLLLKEAIDGEGITIDKRIARIANSPENRFIHWWLEFPDVFFGTDIKNNNVGFDVIIGNPPYGNIVRTAEKKAMVNFNTRDVNEVAANFIERSLQITKKNGFIGFIVANSIAVNSRAAVVRKQIREHMSTRKMALFGIRPAKIFPAADIRVLIFFGKNDLPKKAGIIFTTETIKFTREQRASLFENLSFESTEGLVLGDKIGDQSKDVSLPKIGNSTIRSILLKLSKNYETVFLNISNKPGFEKSLEFRKTGRYWLNALEKMPYQSTKIESVTFENSNSRDFAILLINSSLFYLYWSTYGNSRDFPLSLLEKFPFPDFILLEKNSKKIEYLKAKYSTCLLKYFTPHGTLGEFKTAPCKEIIDEIDEFLGEVYGLNSNEVSYVKNFDSDLRRDHDLPESGIAEEY